MGHLHAQGCGISRNRRAGSLCYRPAMSLRRRDLAALALAAVAVVAGMGVSLLGEVSLGVSLGVDDNGYVRIFGVEPESIAARSGITDGSVVTHLEATDGTPLATRPPTRLPPEFGEEFQDMRFPAEPLPESRIMLLETGFSYEEEDGTEVVYPGDAWLYRWEWMNRLATGSFVLLLGTGFGALAGMAMSRGRLGTGWREEAVPLGVAVAMPFLVAPLFYWGTPFGMVAAFGLAAAGSLPLARSLADRHPVERWPDVLFATSVVIAVTVVLTTLRAVTAPAQPGGGGAPLDRILIVACVALVPAVATALALRHATRERTEMLLIGIGPGASALLLGWTFPNPVPFVAWPALILAWQRLASPVIAHLRSRRIASAPAPVLVAAPEPEAPPLTGWRFAGLHVRDIVALGVAAAAAFGALVTCCDTWVLIIGVAMGVGTGLALQRGFLGAAWREAAIPVACAVAIPIFVAGVALGNGAIMADSAGFMLASLGALPVAHLLAVRHPDRGWRTRLFLLSCGIAFAAMWTMLVVGANVEAHLLMGLIALVPGLVVSFSPGADAGGRITNRLDTLAVAVTPGAAMTVLVMSLGWVPFAAWLALLIAWRRLTIAPLLGLAIRTQRQRDLAVAAVEAERARLAADLHDDALQELSALVRRLDAAGDAEGADLARGVAERLRTITSDLRLPLLDDLGAGPALEGLVGRVRPLADGPVVLERADAERPPAGVELAVFRVAQEALANAVKHGRPPITVRYRVADDGGVSLSVDDSGPGIELGAAESALQAGHLGMANMQQRAQQIGALLDVRRWPAGGTHVALEWRPR